MTIKTDISAKPLITLMFTLRVHNQLLNAILAREFLSMGVITYLKTSSCATKVWRKAQIWCKVTCRKKGTRFRQWCTSKRNFNIRLAPQVNFGRKAQTTSWWTDSLGKSVYFFQYVQNERQNYYYLGTKISLLNTSPLNRNIRWLILFSFYFFIY